VWPTPWNEAEAVLPLLDVLILSHDDLLPLADGNRADADAMLERWAMQVPLLVATDGRHGATLFQHGTSKHFSAYATREVDPTGAGDVFAAAFLTHLYRNGNPGAAMDFANCAASLSIEHQGMMGIPTLEAVMERMRTAGKA
jgi:1D-myo-inositol 3-kinase